MSHPTQPAPRPASDPATAAEDQRRGFLGKLMAVVIGGVVSMVPLLAGLYTIFDPLRRKSAQGAPLFVARLDALKPGGPPQRFPVIADRTDAWNRYPKDAIGAVYLQLLPDGQTISSFNVICPHAGCAVSYNAAEGLYKCPCHTSDFNADGSVKAGPSPRGMDKMETEIRDVDGQKQVWVKFVNYYPGKTEQVAKP